MDIATASSFLFLKTALQPSAACQRVVKVSFSNLPLQYVLDISANTHTLFKQASIWVPELLPVVFVSCSCLSVNNNNKKTPPNQVFHILKSQRCTYLQKKKEVGVQAGSGTAVGGSKDSSSLSHLTFPVLSCTARGSCHPLPRLAGAWGVHGNRFEPKTGQIVYELQLQKGFSRSCQKCQHQGQATCYL